MCSAISARGVPCDDDAALVHDGEAMAQALRLLHEVRREEQRLALRGESPQPLPDEVPRLRVEAGGRLVHDHELRIVDERAREREAPLHAAGERLDARVGATGQAGELEQPRHPRSRMRSRESPK